MDEDAERKLVAHQNLYAALAQVEERVEDAQQDEHVKAWLSWCATRKQAVE